ncbi:MULTISPECIES: GntR family transcriptional regulator [Glycomyces]|uniref:GntR family transcriptional regulator n=2 Tax=Glycomyces TaxID=58113 RepID=A0A9X3PN65_9ACTN|nr:GntR family transcriptional regulator [Glycomyces lechevalierae]MDA1386974.1 GntR family transcriptional regulator [Glycomyces lechevalierae]MDR7341552.1 GntR family transcriptional regulator [Glycomyces lechevalierae]
MIDFHLEPRSGVAPYMQLVHQVQQALRLGMLDVGDQLPTVKQVVAKIAINPNTVLKAYRELERQGLVAPQPGRGTFVTATLADDTLDAHAELKTALQAWITRAREAGLDDAAIQALFDTTIRKAPQVTP